jgi:GH24 family phage-related lysozyme (muramidase)
LRQNSEKNNRSNNKHIRGKIVNSQAISKPSQACYSLIKKWEGLHKQRSNGMIESYQDPVGIWTIGYGSIVNLNESRPVGKDDVISQNEAETWLNKEVDQKAVAVARLCTVPLTQSMFDALVSFAYNLGIGAFEESTLREKLNQRDFEGAAKEFERWVKAGGSVLQGLVNRRNDEEVLFRKEGWPDQAAQNMSPSTSNSSDTLILIESSLSVTAVIDTFFKSQVLGSQDLAEAEKAFIPKGTVIPIIGYSPDQNQHNQLNLSSPVNAKDGKTKLITVYAYEPHIRIDGIQKSNVIKLPVKYRRQTDNEEYSIFGSGDRQCNLTSNTMLADFLLNGELSRRATNEGLREAESAYMRILVQYGDTVDHDAQTRALKQLGIESYFSHSLSSEDLLRSLKADIPVVLGVAYKSGGHICLLVGHDPDKRNWLIHDPYGTRHGYSDSYDKGIGGEYDSYSYSIMQRIFWDQGREAGWGRIVTSINGKSTGLPTGL